jgi:hypothetical protein
MVILTHPADEDMLNFLKKYSPVENAFVDDFFSQVDPASPDDSHTVDLDLISKWLAVRKGNLLKTLRASYQLGTNYVVSKPPSSKGSGNNTRRVVMLTPDCFKTLCMQSKSRQSDRVRAYFIAVEKTLFRYRAEIVDGMRRRIEQLENNQRPIDPSLKRTGVIYVIRAAEGVSANKLSRSVDRVKLGYTGDLSARLRSHGSAKADALEVLYVYKTEDMVAVEACAKGVLKSRQYRKYKEVYEADLDVIKEAIEGCGVLVNKVQRPIPKSPKAVGGGDLKRSFVAFL